MKRIKKCLAAAICISLASVLIAGCDSLIADKTAEPVPTHGSISRPGYRYVYLLAEKTEYQSDGTAAHQRSYTYNEHGIITAHTYTAHRMPNSSYTVNYTFNEKGHLIRQEQKFDSETYLTYIDYVYNENGAITARRSTHESQRTDDTYEYDSEGRLIHMHRKFSYHKGTEDCYYKYDKNGRLYEFSYPDNFSRDDIYTLTYDEQGRMTSAIGGNQDFLSTEYRYDNEGRLIEEFRPNWTAPSFRYSYTNNVLTGIEYVIDPRCSTLKPKVYTLDEFGNTICITSEDGSRTEYSYIRMELTEEDAKRVLLKHPINNGSGVSITAYREDFMEYYW